MADDLNPLLQNIITIQKEIESLEYRFNEFERIYLYRVDKAVDKLESYLARI